MPKEEAEDIFIETLKWLYLCAFTHHNNINDVPTLDIFGSTRILDEMLHTFILCTKDYFSFCENYLGVYIHHQPAPVRKIKLEKQPMLDANVSQIETYESHKRLMSYIYDIMGKETVIKWYGTYLEKYNIEKINSLRIRIQ